MILSELPGRGDRFTIKTDRNTTYTEYKLVGTSTSDSSIVIYSDDCIENERLVIKKDRAERKLRLDMIKRGMSVTEVINDTDFDFHVLEDGGVLKARSEYFIQRDPKDKSELQHYRLVGGEKPAILIPCEDLENNQRLTVSGGDSPAVTSKIPRGIYLTEVFNKTKTDLKVMMKSEASVGSGALEMVTQVDGSQSFTIEYDPVIKTEFWIQTMAEPLKEISIPSAYFVEGKRIDIIMDSSPAGFKLESAEPRHVPTPTRKPGFLSSIFEGISSFAAGRLATPHILL
jgi:hypothetical protein